MNHRSSECQSTQKFQGLGIGRMFFAGDSSALGEHCDCHFSARRAALPNRDAEFSLVLAV
jgi:hypothetical protein